MKGILLAGGSGTRLYPLSLAASKQLQPVYDKPMVYYPLSTLVECGIRDICLISTPHDLPRFKNLLGSGSRFGINLNYVQQDSPKGIAEAFILASQFIDGDSSCLILGDNLFFGTDAFANSVRDFQHGATVFACRVNDPERYGVIEFDADGRAISIEEKPKQPKSRYVVPGFYIVDADAPRTARTLNYSARGELEITDLMRDYLRRGSLRVEKLRRGFAWLDAGTSSSLHEASAYVQTIEKRTGVKLGCPEEAALHSHFLTQEQFDEILADVPTCEYREYLNRVITEQTP